LEKFDKSVAKARAALATAEDAQLMQPWSLKSGEKVFFTMPKVAVLRTFVFNHSVHHRGQLSVYLRLNDIPVPAMYGPSADEQTSSVVRPRRASNQAPWRGLSGC